MRILIPLLTALAVLLPQRLNAQPTILHGPVVDAITYTSARVTWITDVPSSSQIRFGLSAAYDGTTTGSDKVTVHSWYLSGLAPGTTYHFQVCSSAPASGRICSGDQSLKTVHRSSTNPLPPEGPRVQVDTTMPAGAYGESFVIQPDCSNLRPVLSQIATLSGDLNYEVLLPAGTACHGQFVFPARPNHTGWILVRSTQAESLPERVRLRADATPYLATFVTDALPMITNVLANIGNVSNCAPDTVFWAMEASGMPLFVCGYERGLGPQNTVTGVTWTGTNAATIMVPGHGYTTGDLVRISGTGVIGIENVFFRITVLDEDRFLLDGSRPRGMFNGSGTVVKNLAWRQLPYTSGTALPATCSMNDWFFRTDGAVNKEAVYWCTSIDQWTNVRLISLTSGDKFSAIQFAPKAARYRFVGIEVTHIPVPDPPPAGWSTPGYYMQGRFASLITTYETNSYIIFDRCDIHGRDYPSRLAIGLSLDGAHVAVIDSRIHKVNQWLEKADNDLESFAIQVPSGPGPGKFENNFLEAIGITIYFPTAPDGYLRTPPADYEIVRNYISHPRTYLAVSPFNTTGKHYINRHAFELKRGRRMLIEGNVFDGNWADIQQGAFVMLTPRPGLAPAPKPIKTIENDLITAASPLLFYQAGMLVYVSGSNNGGLNGIWEVDSIPASNQIKLVNAPSGTGSSGTVTPVASDIQISDLDFRNNIFRYGPNILWIAGHQDESGPLNTRTTQRIRFINNLVYGLDTSNATPSSAFGPPSAVGILAYVNRGVEDLIIRNNTVSDAKGASPTLLFNGSTAVGASAGLDVRDNIFFGERIIMTRIGGSLYGQTSLDQHWTAHPSPAWQFSNNVFCCTPPSLMRQNVISTPNTWLQTNTNISFQNPVLGDFRLLPSDSLKDTGICLTEIAGCISRTGDPGVDMAELERHLSPDNPPLTPR